MSKPLKLGQQVRFKTIIERSTRDDGFRYWQSLNTSPREGLVMGKRTLVNGNIEFEYDETWPGGHSYFEPKEYLTAYLVAYDVNRKPVFVRAEDIEATEPESDTE